MNNSNEEVEFLDAPVNNNIQQTNTTSNSAVNNNFQQTNTTLNSAVNNQVNNASNINNISTLANQNVMQNNDHVNNVNTTQNDSINTNNDGIVNGGGFQDLNPENPNEEIKPLPPLSYRIIYVISYLLKFVAIFCIGVALVGLFTIVFLGAPGNFLFELIFVLIAIAAFFISKIIRYKDDQYNMAGINKKKNIIFSLFSLFVDGKRMYKRFNRFK